MDIKKVETAELPQLLHISQLTFRETFEKDNNPTDLQAYIDKAFSLEILKNELFTEGSIFYIVENQGITYGYFKLNHNKLPQDATYLSPEFEQQTSAKMTELERIYLANHAQGKGYARAMMLEIERLSRSENSAYIWLGVWEFNLKAIQFYEKCGFTKCGQHVFTIGSDAQNDYLMWKQIGVN